MRLSKYINEEKAVPFSDIMRECKSFITDWKNSGSTRFLYRGAKGKPVWYEGQTRKDRTPRDTPIQAHRYLDKLFKIKFGIYLRSQSLFCVGNKKLALFYSPTLYMIFPVGKYEIFWNPRIGDLGVYVDRISSKDYRADPKSSLTMEDRHEMEIMVDGYKKGNLYKATMTGVEVMVVCDKYYAISTEFEMAMREWINETY